MKNYKRIGEIEMVVHKNFKTVSKILGFME